MMAGVAFRYASNPERRDAIRVSLRGIDANTTSAAITPAPPAEYHGAPAASPVAQAPTQNKISPK